MKRQVTLSLLFAAASLVAGPRFSAAADKPEEAAAVAVSPPPASVQPAGEDSKPPVVPDGWKVETVMIHPKINTPSMVCAIPDGRVLVAEHWLSNIGGKDPVDRILCIHPDGKITVYADKLYAVFGLQYMDGKVYVHHYPVLSVFTDAGNEATDRKDIINRTGKDTIGGLNDHIAAQIQPAMDGYFYMSVGDRGVWGAKSNVDGREAELAGGGILRIRPDGTGLEVIATGTRNHLDVSVTAEDEMFTYDNTDDGHGWWTRFTHMVDGGFYGYPWDYKPTEDKNDPASKKLSKDRDPSVPYQPYTLWRAAEYQGGSPTGAVGYNEDALPEEYRGNVFHCEWGKQKVQRFVVERDGGTFKVAKQEDLLKRDEKLKGGDLRPTGICVTADGLGFYVTDWGYGGWMNKKGAGRLIKVTWAGKNHATPRPAWYVPAATGKPFKATTAELIDGLRHPAESVRLVAQRRIAERGAEAVAPLVALLSDAKAPAHARMFAVWTLDKIDGGKAGRAAVIAVAKDAKADAAVRRQAIRQLGERRAMDGTDAVVSALGDPDASIRFRAATALGRIGNGAAVPAILPKLEEKDLFTRFALFTALHRIGKADPKAWPAIVKGLQSANDAVRANTTYALRNAYDEALVEALAADVSTAQGATGAARAAALSSLAELHRQPAPWAGKWWGTQPVGSPRPPKVVDWAGTPVVLGTIREAIKDSDPAVRQAAIRAMQVAPDPTAADMLVDLFKQEKSTEMRRSVLEALAAAKSPKGSDLVVSVLKDPAANAELVPAAIDAAEQTADKRAAPALVGLVNGNPEPRVLGPAMAALGVLKEPSSGQAVAKHAAHADPMVAMSAVNALAQIGGEPAVRALIGALSDKRPEVRRAAADGLGNLKTPAAAVPALVTASQDKDGDTARNALSALAKTPTLDALDAYLAGAASKNAGTREKAIKALASLGDKGRAAVEAKIDTLSPETLAALQAAYGTYTPLTIWSIVGPFDADKPAPFDLATLDKPASDVKGADGKTVKWKSLTTKAEHGMIDVAQAVGQGNGVYAVLFAEFNSGTERDVDLLVGSDDNHVLYLNGRKIHDDTPDGGWQYDAHTVRAKVKAGRNVLVARCGNSGGGWQFSVNVAAERKGKLFDTVAAGAKKPDRQAFEKFAASAKGSAANGDKLFHNVNGVACIKCHQVTANDDGGRVGPSLQGVGVKYDRAKLIESVLYPSKQIFDGYQQSVVKTKDGDVLYGVVQGESATELPLYDSSAQKTVVKKSDVVSRKLSEVSVMPEGLEQALTPQEFADLIAYLEGLKEKPPEPAKAPK